MTTSILDAEDLIKMINGVKSMPPPEMSVIGSGKSISGQEFIDRIKELFTPEEAEALARRIEEGREQAHD